MYNLRCIGLQRIYTDQVAIRKNETERNENKKIYVLRNGVLAVLPACLYQAVVGQARLLHQSSCQSRAAVGQVSS